MDCRKFIAFVLLCRKPALNQMVCTRAKSASQAYFQIFTVIEGSDGVTVSVHVCARRTR